VKGRKRHIVVDTLGLLLRVVVHPAHIQDRDGAVLLLCRLTPTFSRLRVLWADGGYAGRLLDWVTTRLACTLQIVKRHADVSGFHVLPRRWVVERTFAWLGNFRRLSLDYELLPAVSEAFIYAAMTRLMLRRLTLGHS